MSLPPPPVPESPTPEPDGLSGPLAPPPQLWPMARVVCEVGEVFSLGQAPAGERRMVPLTGGWVRGPELNGRVLAGGVDWQWARSDGVLEIAAHYVLLTPDGARIEVQSTGLRHGPAEVMARLAAGEDVPPHAYHFRTALRFTTGHPDWLHLNRSLALARGERRARQVWLELFRLG